MNLQFLFLRIDWHSNKLVTLDLGWVVGLMIHWGRRVLGHVVFGLMLGSISGLILGLVVFGFGVILGLRVFGFVFGLGVFGFIFGLGVFGWWRIAGFRVFRLRIFGRITGFWIFGLMVFGWGRIFRLMVAGFRILGLRIFGLMVAGWGIGGFGIFRLMIAGFGMIFGWRRIFGRRWIMRLRVLGGMGRWHVLRLRWVIAHDGILWLLVFVLLLRVFVAVGLRDGSGVISGGFVFMRVFVARGQQGQKGQEHNKLYKIHIHFVIN